MIFGAQVRGMVIITLYAFRFVVAIVSHVSIGLTVVTLWWTAYLLIRFFNRNFGIE